MPAFFINTSNMKVIKLNQVEEFSCVPRIYPKPSDALRVTLTNELTNTSIDLSFTSIISGAYLTIIINTIPNDFTSGNKYAIEVYNITSQSIVYLGKLLIVDENTDIQNYAYKSQSNSRFEY